MVSINDFIDVNFTTTDYTSVLPYYKNVLVLSAFEDSDLVSGQTFPATQFKVYSDLDAVGVDFPTSHQVYKEAQSIFTQRSNTGVNASQIDKVVVGQKLTADADFAAALTTILGNFGVWAQLVLTDRTEANILNVAAWAETNQRFFYPQTADTAVLDGTSGNVAEDLKGFNYRYTMLTVRLAATTDEGLSSGIASIATNGFFGSARSAADFSTITGVTAETYTSTQETNLENNNVAYYSFISPVTGGGGDQFGKRFVFNAVNSSGEVQQRRRIIDFIEKQIQARGLDFLAKKLPYEEQSNSVLLDIIRTEFVGFQTNDLVVEDFETTKGFDITVVPLRGTSDSIQVTDPTTFAARGYKVRGYYFDALVGQKVTVDLTIDPTNNDIQQIIGA